MAEEKDSLSKKGNWGSLLGSVLQDAIEKEITRTIDKAIKDVEKVVEQAISKVVKEEKAMIKQELSDIMKVKATEENERNLAKITKLEGDISAKDSKISELQAEVASITTDLNNAREEIQTVKNEKENLEEDKKECKILY